MLTQITLKNFKIFKEETKFPLSKINLLTGVNGKGKSTLLQSLLLMKQSIEEDKYTKSLFLNGNYLKLGNFQDIKNNESNESKILIGYDFDENNNKGSIYYHLIAENKENELLIEEIELKTNILSNICKFRYNPELLIENAWVSENNGNRILADLSYLKLSFASEEKENTSEIHKLAVNTPRFEKINYVAASRIAGQNFYQKNAKSENNADIADIIAKNKNDKNFIAQIGYWLSHILDTPNISLLIDDSTDVVIILSLKIGEKTYKLSNVGFGYSYILPILVAVLTATPHHIIIIENPEAHLHPKAQASLTRFLAEFAGKGIQILIESHSEHILNALRICVIDNDIFISNEDMSILYFHDNEDSKYFSEVPIYKNGDIGLWLDGFFDQTEKDIAQLLGI